MLQPQVYYGRTLLVAQVYTVAHHVVSTSDYCASTQSPLNVTMQQIFLCLCIYSVDTPNNRKSNTTRTNLLSCRATV